MLLYGSEAWKLNKKDENSLQVFVNKCFQKILNIHWPEKISNHNLYQQTNKEEVPISIRERKWKWIGNILRRPADNKRVE